MSRQDRERFQALIDGNPGMKAAYDRFLDQLARDSGFIRMGATPTGRAISQAARGVYLAAGIDQTRITDVE